MWPEICGGGPRHVLVQCAVGEGGPQSWPFLGNVNRRGGFLAYWRGVLSRVSRLELAQRTRRTPRVAGYRGREVCDGLLVLARLVFLQMRKGLPKPDGKLF